MSTSVHVRPVAPVRRALLVGCLALTTVRSASASSDEELATDDPVVADPVGTPTPEEPATTIEVTAVDHSFELSTELVAAGPVTVELTNDGSQPHQVHLAKLPTGTSIDDVVAMHESQGEAELFAELEWAGGVAGVEP